MQTLAFFPGNLVHVSQYISSWKVILCRTSVLQQKFRSPNHANTILLLRFPMPCWWHWKSFYAVLLMFWQVDGFIYYPTKRTESSDDKCHPPTEASATIPPNPTTQGRQRRQAAINNKLVSGGHVSDTNSDGEFRPAPKRRSSAKVSVKKQKVDMDDPQNKLAKVKASLVTTATSPVLAAKTISTAWPTKLSAKQRLSKKLGLNKR